MRRFLIVTHGGFAEGVKQSLTLFLGENHPFQAISAYMDETPLKDQVETFMRNIDSKDQLIILTDIMGGSVNQEMMIYIERPNTYIFTGFNFPMLIALSCLPENADIDAFRKIVDEGKEAIVLMNDYSFSDEIEDGDE